MVLSQEPKDNIDADIKGILTSNGSSILPKLEMTNKPHDHQFDFLMFTQLWPISNCIDWEERNHDNTCSLNGKYVLLWLAMSCKQPTSL